MADFVISTSIDATGVRKGADETSRAFRSLANEGRSQFGQLKQVMKGLDDGSIQKYAREVQRSMQTAGRSGTDYLNIIRRFKPELDALSDGLKRGSISQEDYNRRLKALPPIVQTAIAESKKLGQGIRQVGEETEKTAKQFEKLRDAGATIQNFGSQVSGFGQQLTVGVTAPIVALGVAAVKTFADVESAVAEISSIKPEINTTEVFNALNEMSTRIPQTAKELGNGLYNIFSSIDVDQAGALKLLEVFGKGATAAKTNAETFGTAILGVMNAYKLSVEDAAHVSDVFFNTVNLGVVSGQQLANELGTVTQAAKNVGVSFDELGALIVGVTKEGGPANQNINNLANFLGKISTKESISALKDLGIEVQKDGQFRPMLDVLGEMKTKLDALPPAARALELQKIFPDLQAKTGAQTLLSQLDAVKEALEVNKTTAGAAEAAYQKIAGTTAVQLSLLKNSAVAILAELGSALLPILQPILMWIGGTLVPAIAAAVAHFKTWSPALQTIAVAFAAVMAAIGPILIALGGAIAFIGAIVTGIGAIAASVALLKIIIPVLLGFVLFLAQIATAVALLYAAWKSNFGGIRDYTIAAYNTIKGVVTTAMSTLLGIVRSVGGAIVAWWRDNYDEIRQVVETVSNGIKNTISTFLAAVEKFWNEHGGRITSYLTTYWGYLKSLFSQVMTQLGAVLTLGLQIMNGNWEGAWQTFLQILQNGGRMMATLTKGTIELIVRLIAALVPIMFQYGGQIAGTLISWITKAAVGVFHILATLPTQIVRLVPKFLSAGRSIASAIWQGIKSGLSGSDVSIGDSLTDLTMKNPLGGGGVAEGGGAPTGLGTGSAPAMPKLGGLGGLGGGGGTNALSKKELEISERGKQIIEAAGRLGIDPLDLAIIISYETAKTFSPTIRGGKGNNYVGLIQFGPEEQQKYKIGKNNTFESQLFNSVIPYFRDRFRAVGRETNGASLLDLYKTVNGGNPNVSSNASDSINPKTGKRNTIATHVAGMQQTHRASALSLFGGKPPEGKVTPEKTLLELADENLYNAAKQRVQDLTTLSRELGVALTVPETVTTSNQELILQQQIELHNLNELKDARQKVRDGYIELLPVIQALGETEANFASGNLEEAKKSLEVIEARRKLGEFAKSELGRTAAELRDLKNGVDSAQTPLEKFDSQLTSMAEAAGISREMLAAIYPEIEKIRKNLIETAKIKSLESLKKNAIEAQNAISSMAQSFDRDLAGLKDKTPEITSFIESLEKIEQLNIPEGTLTGLKEFFVTGNQIDLEKFTAHLQLMFATLAEVGLIDPTKIDGIIDRLKGLAQAFNQFQGQKTSDAGAEYRKGLEEELFMLQRGGVELTKYEQAQRALATSYKHLSDAQKNEILNLAAAIDATEAAQRQYAEFSGFINDSLTTLANEGFGGFFRSVMQQFKSFLLKMASEWLASKLMNLLGGGSMGSTGGGSGSGGGGILGSLLGGLFGGGSGSRSTGSGNGAGPGGTPLFNPNGGSWYEQNRGVLEQIRNGGNTSGPGSAGGSGLEIGGFGGSGAVGSDIFAQAQGQAAQGAAGMFALTALAGSLIGGRAGSTINMAVMGAQIGMMFGPIGMGIGAAAGALLGFFGFSDPKRKVDKKENMPKLQQGFTDAMAQLKAILADRNAIFSDPDGAIAKATELRTQIASGFGIQFQSKKYRKQAQSQITAKLAEADVIIKQITDIAKIYRGAGLVDDRLETSFATGVYMSKEFLGQYTDHKRRNGILPGSWTGRDTLPSMLAAGEMVLNPRQIERVKLNAGFDVFRGAGIPNYATGVYIPPTQPSRSEMSSAPAVSGQPVTVQIVLNNSGIVESDIKDVLVNGLKDTDVQVEVVKAYDKGKSRSR